MPVKYECPKCGRRFTEWGAEKVGFKCPKDQWCPKDHPDDVELVRVGPSEEGASRRPTLKRTPRKLAQAKAPVMDLEEDEGMVPDMDELEGDDEFEDEDDETGVIDDAEEEEATVEADAPDTVAVIDDDDAPDDAGADEDVDENVEDIIDDEELP
ncbi:MAG TPA: hypothetical protein PLD73_09635 [Candidatus Hydrogenedentes bacterium]|nr:hypothetical protein [Candidatus Hydrogenedentota bacterium]HPJ98827.1 hypothetical protein [Candidatus Hydrogenedentota bacterium]